MDITPSALYSNLMFDLDRQCKGLLGDILNKPVREAADAREAAMISISNSLLKKFEQPNSDITDSRALLKFLTVNKAVRDWRLVLENDEDHILFGELKRSVREFWSFDQCSPLVSHNHQILDFGRCGPGASVSSGGGDEYTKMYSSPLSTTSKYLYDEYKRYVALNPSTLAAEEQRSELYGSLNIVSGSRLSFVPKNDSISRCICIEPSLNMFYQLGFGHILEQRLLTRFGINLAHQQFKNQELARIGSVFDNLCTIDLESASDSLGLKMLSSVLPSDFYSYLVRLRSPSTDIPGIGTFELDMVSTMGNGFTFPLQTMLFSCVVHAAFRKEGIRPNFPRGICHGDWGVFGDDIIVPKEILSSVLRLLDILGFVVNKAKTFVEGPFRESCGVDFFRGINVRGIYAKSLSTMQDRYALINQLNLFSTRTGIQLTETVKSLLLTVKFLPVPLWENDDSGIKCPFSFIETQLPRSKRYQSILYTCYRPMSKKLLIGESAIFVPRRSKPRKWNPHGLYLCFLKRSVNDMSIGVRHDKVRYVTKRCIAPSWGGTPATHPLSGWFPWKRCESAFYLNLFG